MPTDTAAILRDLARAKLAFQQRTVLAVLTQRPPVKETPDAIPEG